MRSAWFGTAALVLLGACADRDEVPRSEEVVTTTDTGTYAPEQVPGSVPIIAVDGLIGEYRVAGIGGEQIDAPVGLSLSIANTRIIFPAHCGGYAWDYTLEAGALSTVLVMSPDPNCQTRAPVHPAVYELVAALDAVTGAERTPQNAIRLSGGGRSVTLFSQ